MRIIDARTGDDVEVGKSIVYDKGITYMYEPSDSADEIKVKRLPPEEPGWYRIMKVEDRVFGARALIEGNKLQPRIQWIPLRVRITHPGFRWQRVAFVPT